jgi:hypothetical protein
MHAYVLILSGIAAGNWYGNESGWSRYSMRFDVPFPNGFAMFLRYWAPFVALASIGSDAPQNSSGWAVDGVGLVNPDTADAVSSVLLGCDLAARNGFGAVRRIGQINTTGRESHDDQSGVHGTAGRAADVAVVHQRRPSARFDELPEHGTRLHRRARRGGYRPTRRTGPMGLLGRLISLVVSLAVLAVAVSIALLIVRQAAPNWFEDVTSWFHRAF